MRTGEPIGPARWQMSLTNEFGTPFYSDQGWFTTSVMLPVSLPLGTYRFQVGTFAGADTDALNSITVDSNFVLTLADEDVAPVPEPTSLLLLGTGLAGILRCARSRQRMPHPRRLK